ncbi:MAG: hypothetical protein WDM96_02915 [Lacunisphaera sp.]
MGVGVQPDLAAARQLQALGSGGSAPHHQPLRTPRHRAKKIVGQRRRHRRLAEGGGAQVRHAVAFGGFHGIRDFQFAITGEKAALAANVVRRQHPQFHHVPQGIDLEGER